MNFEPQKFFIGVIDLFSVILPGALLTYLLMVGVKPACWGPWYPQLIGTAGWLAFLVSSYLFGHFIFLIGAAFLDDCLYDPIRKRTRAQNIRRLANGGKVPWKPIRLIADRLFKAEADAAQSRAIMIKDHYVGRLGAASTINAFQWCKARLTLEKLSEATATVQRFEADSKFFRSFAVVICVAMAWGFYGGWGFYKKESVLAVAGLPFLGLALWRYIDQRAKATTQSYWYVIALEANSSDGYRPVKILRPSHAGGVVYRWQAGARRTSTNVEFLLVQAKKEPEWVLPKGHVETEERMTETAVREVLGRPGPGRAWKARWT